MTWDDQIAQHERKIRRHSMIVGILIGAFGLIGILFLINYISAVATW